MTRVVIADDQELLRFGFAALIDAEDDLNVVGEATNGAEAVDLAHTAAPDVILMDIRMPEMDGIEATKRIVSDHRLAKTKILILTTFNIDELVYESLRAGASGFLLKDTPPQKLVDGVRTIASGNSLIDPVVTKQLVHEFVSRPKPETSKDILQHLTDREVEVLTHVGMGESNDEIAASLLISPLTAKTHVSRVISKLGVRDRAQLVVSAYETGLVVASGNNPGS